MKEYTVKNDVVLIYDPQLHWRCAVAVADSEGLALHLGQELAEQLAAEYGA